jgi:hypothetical protein
MSKVKSGDTYFLESLAEHFGHKVVIAKYTDYSTGLVADYRLHCENEDCESPVGICVEIITEPNDENDVAFFSKDV